MAGLDARSRAAAWPGTAAHALQLRDSGSRFSAPSGVVFVAEWKNSDAAWATQKVRAMWLRCLRFVVAERDRDAQLLRRLG
jgi:hypothetical protein